MWRAWSKTRGGRIHRAARRRHLASEPLNTTAVGDGPIAVEVQESVGTFTRRPRSADIVHTALGVLGVENVRIPGGSGEIVGVRRE
jgi:hypothetical protein